MLSENILKQTSNNFSNLSINTSPSPTSSVNTNTTSSSHISSTSSKSSSTSTNSTNSTNSTQSTRSTSPTDSDTNSLNDPHINNLTENRQERRRKLSDPHCLPSYYEAHCQARVRSGWQLTSTHLTDLPRGSVVTVEEIKENTNRARISAPIHGWLSIISKHGDTILMPLNKETAKIGGKVLFSKNYFKNNQKSSITAKIVDYNGNYGMHKVRHKDGKHEWINLKNRHIRYIPQNQIYSKMIDPVRETEDFFVQFFKEDYPQFVHKPRPKRKNDWNNNNIKLAKYDMNKYKFDEYGNNGYIANDLVFKYKNNQNNKNHKHNKNNNNSKHLNLGDGYYGYDLIKIQKQLKESRNKILHSLNGRYNKYGNNINNNNNNNNHNGILNTINIINNNKNNKNNNNNNNKKAKIIAMKQQQQQQKLLQKQQQQQQQQNNVEVKEEEEEKKITTQKKPQCTCNNHGKTKCNPEFIKKIKEIEKKIIDHLHKRGYYEDNPMFWQYIKKAKQLAIERAKKERAKILAQRQAQQQD